LFETDVIDSVGRRFGPPKNVGVAPPMRRQRLYTLQYTSKNHFKIYLFPISHSFWQLTSAAEACLNIVMTPSALWRRVNCRVITVVINYKDISSNLNFVISCDV